MSGKTYLITGANRGVGLGLVGHYLSLPNTTVIATVRSIAKSASAFAGVEKAKGEGSKLIVVEIDSADHETPKKAIEELQTKYGIDHLDTVIANAGVADAYTPLAETPLPVILHHYNVNAVAPVVLFQSTRSLLSRSSHTPTFVVVSSIIGSTELIGTITISAGAYSAAKNAVNHYTAKLAWENPTFNIFMIHPGHVDTEMGDLGAKQFGIAKAPVSVAQSVAGLTNHIDKATIETTSGQFLDFDKEERLPW